MRSALIILFLHVCINAVHGQFAQDSIAICAVLERESATWRSGDVKSHADCWQIQPYSRILVSTGDGKVIDVPPQVMIEPGPGMMGQGGYSKNSDYRISILGDRAWVSHTEESYSVAGKLTRSYEIRMLERIKGTWKLVGQSIHILP